LSVDPKRGKTIDLYTKEREGKLHADWQSRSPMPSTSAEPSSSAWGQARKMGAGEAGGGKRGWWGQARPMGTVSHRPHARARQHRTLGKPPGQIPSQHSINRNCRRLRYHLTIRSCSHRLLRPNDLGHRFRGLSQYVQQSQLVQVIQDTTPTYAH